MKGQAVVGVGDSKHVVRVPCCVALEVLHRHRAHLVLHLVIDRDYYWVK